MSANVTPFTPDPAIAGRPNWKRGAIALLLSILQTGLGQIYNRQPVKAIAYFLFLGGMFLIYRVLALWSSFAGFMSFLLVLLVVGLIAIVDATRVGLRQTPNSPFPIAPRGIQILALVLASASLIANGSGFLLDQIISVKAFKVPSISMSPTIMNGDRIIADMHAYSRTTPHRGDVVVFMLHHPMESLLVKRVVAIGGDTIEGTDQGVVVNGEIVQERYLSPVDSTDSSGIKFKPRTIPGGEFFLLGDNRQESYDSRYFGPVKTNDIRGKALFLYWATNHSRIGTQIR
jgi:signal peptidase I